jgi:hypothetical protein
MKRSVVALAWIVFCGALSLAQKGKADPDYYPMGYSGDTWTGEVIAVDNSLRTLTLTFADAGGNNLLTFVASIPDAPYEWRRDGRNFRVVDFPYNKEAKYQVFKYVGPGDAASILPGGRADSGMERRPSPPDKNVISELAEFMGRRITVYYTSRERTVNGNKEKYNDVWRIRILSGKKK